jgi:hypothetical protein
MKRVRPGRCHHARYQLGRASLLRLEEPCRSLEHGLARAPLRTLLFTSHHPVAHVLVLLSLIGRDDDHVTEAHTHTLASVVRPVRSLAGM